MTFRKGISDTYLPFLSTQSKSYLVTYIEAVVVADFVATAHFRHTAYKSHFVGRIR